MAIHTAKDEIPCLEMTFYDGFFHSLNLYMI
uniref:Uncharacterized protein n=1 Tax=Rhizophora mucronata TaxID=61149 RepID=A0A2P2N630_RHIMU